MANVAKKKKATTDPNAIPETKSARFVRLATARVTKATKAIYNIGNLGGAGYESTQEQRDKIIDALTKAVEQVQNRLNKEQAKPTGFSL